MGLLVTVCRDQAGGIQSGRLPEEPAGINLPQHRHIPAVENRVEGMGAQGIGDPEVVKRLVISAQGVFHLAQLVVQCAF